MSTTIYAGSMQFVAVDLLSSGASLVSTAIMTLLVNARHIIYGISMLSRYANKGKEKPYLIFALTDETYALLCDPVPQGLDSKKYDLYISALDQLYWITGSVIGSLLGSALPFDTAGIDFAMTALFKAGGKMINATHSLLLILVMSLVTIVLRFLPFGLFPSGDKIPAPMLYLSKVLPCAVMGMLVVYCLKNVTPLTWPYALPETLAIIFIVLLQIWRHNTLLSILLGTVVYMFLLQVVFGA